MSRNRSRRKTITIRPDPNTHVCVLRGSGSPGTSSGDWLETVLPWVLNVAFCVAGIWFFLWLLAGILPWLVVGAACWFFLRFQSRR
jgi:hypothetical protein